MKSRECPGCKQPLVPTQIIKTRPDGSTSLVRLPGPTRCPECAVKKLRSYNRTYKRVWRQRRRKEGLSV